jgi:hypothetical protein
MKKLLTLFLIFSLALGCNSENILLTDLPNGTYIGVFHRVASNIKTRQAEISIQLNNGTFEGTSNIPNYPAICSGTYNVDGDEVTFENACAFTADFDWTYILSGTFKVSLHDKELLLVKDYNTNGQYDIYTIRLK